MKFGSKIYLILSLYFFATNLSIAEQKITSTPLLNIDKIKPSFENLEEGNENTSSVMNLKEKKT